MMKPRLLLLVPIAVVACSDGAPIDIGHDQPQLSDFAAHWDGYAEAYTFVEDSSDRVRLTLDANGVGTIQVGDDPLFPPSTDPDVGPAVAQGGPFRNGYLYPVHDVVVEGSRIRFGIDAGEIYADWCAIVPSIPSQKYPGVYRCIE